MKKMLLAASLLIATPMVADVIFTLGNQTEANEHVISFATDQTSAGIFGKFAGNQRVEFASPDGELEVKAGAQAITAVSGLIRDLVITLAPHTFKGFILNPTGPVQDNDLLVEVETNVGGFNFTYGNTTGNNYLTVLATSGTNIDAINVISALGFQELKNPVIIAPVPEVSSLLLVLGGAGLLLFYLVIRRHLPVCTHSAPGQSRYC